MLLYQAYPLRRFQSKVPPRKAIATIALALARHPQIQQHFQEGILWVGLGQQPPILETMHRWGELLGLSASEMASLTTLPKWTRRLRQQIGSRRMLLILDD